MTRGMKTQELATKNGGPWRYLQISPFLETNPSFSSSLPLLPLYPWTYDWYIYSYEVLASSVVWFTRNPSKSWASSVTRNLPHFEDHLTILSFPDDRLPSNIIALLCLSTYYMISGSAWASLSRIGPNPSTQHPYHNISHLSSYLANINGTWYDIVGGMFVNINTFLFHSSFLFFGHGFCDRLTSGNRGTSAQFFQNEIWCSCW